MATELRSLFRVPGPSQDDIESFHNDGYIAFPDIFTDHARESLIKEIEGLDQVREFVSQLQASRGDPNAYFIRPWNDPRALQRPADRRPIHHRPVDGHHWRGLPLLPFCA